MSSRPRTTTLIATALAAGVITYALTSGSVRDYWDRLMDAAGAEQYTGGDRDCRDFGTWLEAQLFYMRHWPGDPHGLDGDNDLIACEHLPWTREVPLPGRR